MIKNLFLTLFCFFCSFAYSLEYLVQCGNTNYIKKEYEAAYEDYTFYLFQNPRHKDIESYYAAWIGRSACIPHLDIDTIFRIESSFIRDLIDSELNEYQRIILEQIIDNSVLMQNIRKD